MTVDGQQLRLRGEIGKEGKRKIGKVVAIYALAAPAYMTAPLWGATVPGGNAKIAAGTIFKLYTDEEKRVSVPGSLHPNGHELSTASTR